MSPSFLIRTSRTTSILMAVNGIAREEISTTQRFRNAEAKLVLSILQDLWERAKLERVLLAHTEIQALFVSGLQSESF